MDPVPDLHLPDVEQHLQTHLSHVFLTPDRVYKLHKPVDLGFVDFTTRAERQADCVREVRLNRRLAPDVYPGVAAVEDGRLGPVLDPDAETPDPEAEWVTVMRRLPADRDALSLLRAGALAPHDLDGVTADLAAFHARTRLEPGPDWKPPALAEISAPLRENVAVLRTMDDADTTAVDALAERIDRFEREHGPRLEARLREGHAVDGHGDLHLDHVWFDRDGGARVIDCLEFRADWRRIDVANEMGFLTMDLRYRGAGVHAERVLARYAAETDDFELYTVLRYYESYRAAVRAKVAGLAARDRDVPDAQRAGARDSLRAHLDLAVRLLDEPRPGQVVLMSGWVGTGKSTAARALADALSAVTIASDRVRKQRAGVAPTDSLAADWGQGAYTADERAAVYDALWQRALPALRAGRDVILDASFAQTALRERVAERARALGREPWLVQTVCDDAVTRERLAQRRAAGRDASDAGPELLDASRAHYEAPDEWREATRVQIDTAADRSAHDALAELAARIRAARFG